MRKQEKNFETFRIFAIKGVFFYFEMNFLIQLWNFSLQNT